MVSEYQRQRQQQDDLALRNVFQAAVKTDPKVAAEAATLAQRLQVSPEQLPDDLEVARAMAKERQFDELKASLTDPLLRERFKDVKFVRMLHDDLGNLKTTIDTFDWFWRNYESGSTINEAGELKARQAFLRQNGANLPPADLDRLAEIDRIQQAAEFETGFFDEAAKLVGQMVQPAVRATGAGLLAAGVAAPTGVGAAGAFAATSLTAYATQAAVVEFGHQYSTIYEQLTAAGVDPLEAHETALVTGGAYALGAGAIEALSGGIVGKPFLAAGKMVGRRILGLARPTIGRAAGTLARETLQSIAAETGEEGAQELLGALAQNIAGQMQGKDTGPSLEESLKAAGEVMLKTAKGMAVLGPIGPALHFAADTRRAAQAKKTEELFTRIADTVKESEVAKRSPDVLKQVVDAKTQGTELDSVFIAAPRLAEALRTLGQSREQFAASAPAAAKRLEQAEAEGGDVEIPMGEFAAGIAGSDLFPAIKPALRTRYGATIEEAQQFEAEREQNKQEAAKAVAEARARVVDWSAQADRVEQRMLAEVRSAATNLSPTQATHYATLHRHWIETQAAKIGSTPEAFDAQFRATVKSNRTGDAGLVSQDAGGGITVFHGTRATFDGVPDPTKSREGSEHGSVVYVTDRPGEAMKYGPTREMTLRGKVLDGEKPNARLAKRFADEIGAEYNPAAVGKLPFDIAIQEIARGRGFTLREREDRVNAVLRAAGYVARSYREDGRATSYAVFDAAALSMASPRTDSPQESQQLRQDAPAEVTPEFRAWFDGSKVVGPDGKPLVVYHGSRRPDRIGKKFRKARATSGPMAFFTDSPELASSYAMQKADTSIEPPADYAGWFRYTPKRARSSVDISRAWHSLSTADRDRLRQLAPRVTTNDAGDIVLAPEGHTSGTGGFDYHLTEAKGNVLKALVEEWLNSGTLFNAEHEFLDVLRLAGFSGKVDFESPWRSNPGVFPVYLSIANPLDTSNVPDSVVAALEKASRRQRAPLLTDGMDAWDKRTRNARDWVAALKADVAAKANSHVWTSIPDWVTKTLQGLGYDGIRDKSGKSSGVERDVWIPFEENQVKSVANRRPTSRAGLLNQDTPGLFSALRRTLDKQVDDGAERQTAAEWDAAFKKWVSEGLLKPSEYEWSGLPEFFKANQEAHEATRFQLFNPSGRLIAFGRASDVERWRRTIPDVDVQGGYEIEERRPTQITKQELLDILGNDGGVTVTQHLGMVEPDVQTETRYIVSHGARTDEYDTYKAAQRAADEINTDLLNDLLDDVVTEDSIEELALPGGWVERPFDSFETWVDKIFRSPKNEVLRYAATGYLNDDSQQRIRGMSDEQFARFQTRNLEDTEFLRGVYESLKDEYASDQLIDVAQAKATPFSVTVGLPRKLARRVDFREVILSSVRVANGTVVPAEDGALEVLFPTELDAKSFVKFVRQDVREVDQQLGLIDRVYVEEVEAEVSSDEPKPSATFKDWAVAGPFEDYREVTIHLNRQSGKKTSFKAPKHYFDDDKSNENQLAHYRYTTRSTRDGEEVMFVDEVQSDYADKLRRQKGPQEPAYGKAQADEVITRAQLVANDAQTWFETKVSKRGPSAFIASPGLASSDDYVDAVKVLEAHATALAARGALRTLAQTRSMIALGKSKAIRAKFARKPTLTPTEQDLAELRALDTQAEEYRLEADRRESGAAIDRPFARSTDAWVTLVLKNVLLTAFNEGRSAIVFANGAQNADVYSLSKAARSIKWEFGQLLPNQGDGVYPDRSRATKVVTVTLVNGARHRFQINQAGYIEQDPGQLFTGDPSLDSVVGKEVAKSILEDWSTTSDAEKVFDMAEDTLVGAVGMYAFYGNDEGLQANVHGKTLFDAKGKPIPSLMLKNLRELAAKIGAEVEIFDVPTEAGGKNLGIRLTPEVRKRIMEGFPLFQGDARGSFDPRTNEIFLNPTHNATTLLHELSHFWLTTLFRMASAPDAPESVRKDAATVLNWFKVDSLDAWNAMSLEEQRKHHEAWAYNAEAHFFGEGKAPTNDAELVSLFRTFARWVRAVYRNARDVLNKQYRRLFGVDLPALTPEVRDVFDRLIASEDAIEAARVDRAMTPLLKDKPADMSDEDWALYQKADRDSQDEALEKLQADSLRSIKWLGNNTARLARKMQAQTRKLRKQVEDEVRAALEKQPVYRAMQELRYGELDTGEGKVPFKLNLDEFRMLGWIGDKTAEEVETVLGVGVSGMLRRGGVPLDFAASMFGFDGGADLVRQLVEAKPLDVAVREQTDQRMLAEHSDLTDPEKVRAAIEKALHNEARTKMVAAELRWLTKVTSPIGLMTRAARAYAREAIGRKLVGQVRPHEHAQAEVRNRREAERWLIRGDLSKAASFKRRELLESQLEREALVAREEVQAVEELVKKLAKRDEKLAATRDTDFVAAARFLAATYGMMPGEKAPADYVAKLRAYNPQLAERLSDQLLPARRSPTEATSWKDLTVDEFRDVKETLEALWNQSLREKQFQVGDAKAKLDDVAAEVVAQDAKLPPPKGKPAGFVDRLKRLIARPEHWAHRRDGGEVGVFTRYFWRPVRAAVERYVVDRNRYTKKLADLVTGLQPKLKQGLIEFRDSTGKLLHTFGKKNGGFGHSELVGALLHIGNDSNLKKLLVGRGWGTYDVDTKVLNSAEWDKFVQSMIDRGYITKEVMDFVQAVWDLNEELKPLAQKTHRDLFGFYFKEIEARSIATQWGNYRGGYVPAKLDEDAASASRVQSLADLEADFRKQFATTGRGFTRERVEDFAEPLSLDLELLPRHVDNVLRFAHIQPAIRDVERLARHRDVGAVLEARDPGVWQGMLLPWLQRVASQSITRPGKSKDVDAFWKFVRSSAGVSTMFANIPNALQQLTGVLTAALKVKPRYLFHGLGRLLNERSEVYAQIAEFSPFMANRQGRQVFDSIEQIEEVAAKKSPLAKARGWVQRHGYFLQSKMQNLVDPIVWTGAYKQARDAAPVGTSDEDAHAEAVKQADAAVRMTQSSFDPTDVANYEEGTPFYRLWTMFSGYFNTIANLQADQWVKMSRAAGWAKAGAAFQLYALGFAAPMLVAEAITRTLRGRWDDEDEDGDIDVLTFDFLFMSQLRSAIAEVPVAGPGLIAPAINAFDNQPWNDRMTTSPAVSVLERSVGGTADAIKVLAGLKKDRNGNPVTPDGRVIRDPLTLLGLVSGLPGSAAGTRLGYAYDRASGAIEGQGLPSDAWALISGSAPRPAR